MDVQPQNQNIDKLFSNTTFYIDFYQRQYKWSDEPVKRLLDDIFYKFNEEYKKYKELSLPLDQVVSKYGWYYLNTYVTNNVDGKLYIVDGQQSLTTLTLLLLKLRHQAKDFKSKLEGWVSSKIVGLSGYKTDFWMNHEAHKLSMQGLYDGKDAEDIDVSSGLTAQNMVSNYGIISSFPATSSLASVLVRDAYYGATNVINQTQRPQTCCKRPLRSVAGKKHRKIFFLMLFWTRRRKAIHGPHKK